MRLPAYVARGSLIGLGVGMPLSAYMGGVCSRLSDEDNPMAFAVFMASSGSLFGAPMVGAGAGGALFVAKRGYLHFRALPKFTRACIAIPAAIGIGMAGAYLAGRRGVVSVAPGAV